jgi:hypothetical protein
MPEEKRKWIVRERKNTAISRWITKQHGRRCALQIFVTAASLCAAAASAHADAVTLDFNAFQPDEGLGTYYSGGVGALGTGPGPNLASLSIP